MNEKRTSNRYERIIEEIFRLRYTQGSERVCFSREDIVTTANNLGIELPKNLGDVIYSFRYRNALPEAIRACVPSGKEWIILPVGRALYAFVASSQAIILPREMLSKIKIPDSTPGVIEMYSLSDEQALLARVRYNRLIDVFTGVACYSLQNHLRTSIKGMGQVETDELYVGIDQRGAHFVFPVQAKGGRDKLSIVQISQDFAVCENKFPELICRPIAAQFMNDEIIALFEFELNNGEITIRNERHYQLLSSDNISSEDIAIYRQSVPGMM